ncbi:MAG: hypothetical protein ACK535_12170 [Cyanobacteriota bacterium]
MSEPWFIARSVYDLAQRSMEDKILIQSRPLADLLDRGRLLIFAWNAAFREYNCFGLMASQWQMLNP